MLTNQLENNEKSQNIPAHLQVCFGGFSGAGIKLENQDAFAALVPKSFELKSKGAVVAIADGVSSASKAAEASQLAVTQFINEYYATPETWSTQKSAAKVLASLNNWLYSQGGIIDDLHLPDSPQWLTTFSTLILKSTTGYIFHVGDTRITRFREQLFESVTLDHNRKQGSNQAILTRALGADPRVKVDAHKVDIKTGDIYLLTCDGVHDFVQQKDLKAQLTALPALPNKSDLEQASKNIVDIALANGSDDNVSCVLVFIASIPSRKFDEITRDLTSKTIPPALQVGQKLDGYVVKKVIHASIRSHLYLVEHPEQEKRLVLKAPSSNFADDPIYLQGFLREAWVGERIKHGNVMRVQAPQTESKFLYHLCEFIEGQTLSDWIHDNPKPTISEVRDIMSQVFSALRSFQRLDLVHRDLKPDNIMIDNDGHIKLIDYGTVFVASLDENLETLEETVPQGSLNYIAPETLLTMQADHQSDLFSLGIICYEMLTGNLPYKPMQRAEVTQKSYDDWRYISAKQYREDLPLWLDICLEKATSPSPKQRYQAYSEFYADLSKPNVSALENYKSQPLIQRNPVQFWQGLSAILFIAFIIALID